jgi:Fe-S-cluster containining protein
MRVRSVAGAETLEEERVALDTRVRGPLTKRLVRFAKTVIDWSEWVDRDTIVLEHEKGPFVVPDCPNCTSKCCVHKEVGSGILLSLRDIAHLIDSGMEDLIVGTFTFKRMKDGDLDIDQMPRLAKKQGNCVFYDEKSGLCEGYGVRPSICRRFPYEVHRRRGSGKPFARFIPWAPCPTLRKSAFEPAVRQMAVDAVDDENFSFEDAMLLPKHVEDLRAIGFARVLPPATRKTPRRKTS